MGGRLTIADFRGQVVRRISGFSRVTNLRSDEFATREILHIATTGNSAFEYSQAVYLEHRPNGLRSDLVLTGGSPLPITQMVNRMPLLLSTTSETQAWSGDFQGHGGQPYEIPIVLAWNGHRYALEPKRYPDASRVAARGAQYSLIAAIHATDTDWSYRYYTALYYGNMLEIGEGKFAHRWVMRHLPASMRTWFREYAPSAKNRFRHSCVRATAPQSENLHFKPMYWRTAWHTSVIALGNLASYALGNRTINPRRPPPQWGRRSIIVYQPHTPPVTFRAINPPATCAGGRLKTKKYRHPVKEKASTLQLPEGYSCRA